MTFRTFILLLISAMVFVACSSNPHVRPDADSSGARDAGSDVDAVSDAEGSSDADELGDSDGGYDADPDRDVPTLGGGDAPEEVIPRALFEPDIDGELHEWPTLRYRLDTETTVLRYGPDQSPSLSDAQLLFDLRWTEQALYFVAAMNDDEAYVDSPMVWQDDSVELYVDGDNNDDVPTYDENDHQYTVTRDLRFTDQGEPVDATAEGIRFAVTTDGADYIVELALPWSQFGEALPVEGRVLGIDVAFNDDDNGEDEDSHLVMWLAHHMTELGSPVQDTSLFQDLVLGE